MISLFIDTSTANVSISIIKDNKILSMGYNGFPKGCSDDEFPWARVGETVDTKYAKPTSFSTIL